jgi:hypothetical protein
MDFQRFNSCLTDARRRDEQVIAGHWLANRDDLRRNTVRIEQRLDVVFDDITDKLAAMESAIAKSRQHRQTVIDARFVVLRAEVTAPESLWQLTKKIVPIVLALLPLPLAVAALTVSILGGSF